MATASVAFKSRKDHRKQKELEEARKAGLAPAEVDEGGKEINLHIPKYLTIPPLYAKSEKPSLKHQKNWKTKPVSTTSYYDRGAKTYQAEKYRKGACQNCGAMTHDVKTCMERPRKVGAKYTDKNIAPDEKIESLEFDYDGKRDRWNGYDPSSYCHVRDRHEAKENAREKYLKEQQLIAKLEEKNIDGEEEDLRVDEAKIDESMQVDFAKDIHMQAAPSQAELCYKRVKIAKEKLNSQRKDAIIAKYGDAAAKDDIPMELLLGQSKLIKTSQANGIKLCSNAIGKGYRLISMEKSPDDGSFIGYLQVKQSNKIYGSDITILRLFINYRTDHRLRVHITDAKKQRWEVPYNLLRREQPPNVIGKSRKSPVTVQEISGPELILIFTVDPFSFAVRRRSNGETIFNTSSSDESFGEMVFKDQYLEISTSLPKDASLYGFGENSQANGIKLVPNEPYTLFTEDVSAFNLNTDLYGSHPVYTWI
ncbi:hypothetical protein AXX17_AT3G39780 [Arabidopsis thaliana]|uniref:Pre-mRNA-splicing factor SLU7 n=1 Tax=Arabidopsis thaliana TaxID=3702 RepID=A0A178VLI4_ARATH|nr:hypothetical protein AXX17_AT3G39780 [Arabidopsis thaliana]